MKYEIPPISATAPTTIASALPVLRLLPPAVAVVLVATAVGVALVVGVGTGATGLTPPESGLLVVAVAVAVAAAVAVGPEVVLDAFALACFAASAVGIKAAVVVAATIAAFVYLWTMLSFAPVLIVLERLPVFAAIGRSFALVRGSFWRVFGIRALGVLVAQLVANLARHEAGVRAGEDAAGHEEVDDLSHRSGFLRPGEPVSRSIDPDAGARAHEFRRRVGATRRFRVLGPLAHDKVQQAAPCGRG